MSLGNIVHAYLWRRGQTAFTAREIAMILCGARRLITTHGDIVLGLQHSLDRVPDGDAIGKFISRLYIERAASGESKIAINALVSDIASVLMLGDFQCVGVDVAILPGNEVERNTLWIATKPRRS